MSIDPNLALSAYRILVVDDAPLIRLILANWLERMGANVLFVESIAQAREQLTTHPFDFALVDDWLPDGHGAELLPMLRQCKVAHVVALTTIDSDEEARQLIAEGFDDVLPKPLAESELQRVLRGEVRWSSSQGLH